MRWLLWGALGLAACGKGDDSAARTGPPVAPPAPDVAAAVDAAADVATAASPAWEGDPGNTVVAPGAERTLRVKAPFRGVPVANAPVFVARDADPRAAIRRAFDDLGVRIPGDRRVVVLVNLGGYDRIRRKGGDNGVTGRVTDLEFARALLVELRARGVRDLAVAGGASKPASENPRVLAASGYGAMLADLGIPFVDLNHYGDGDSRPAPWRMDLPWAAELGRELVLSDDLVHPERPPYVIDVPKLKAHRFAVMTASIKNLMGAVMIDDPGRTSPPWRRRWRMHRELSPWMKGWRKDKSDDRAAYKRALARFSARLADLYGALTPDLVLIEGYPAMQGDGFARVVPYGGGPILIASRNGVFADYVGAEFFGLHDSAELEGEIGYRMPPAIQVAAERYFGGVAGLRAIAVRGDTGWRTGSRAQAWFKAMAPFELNARP